MGGGRTKRVEEVRERLKKALEENHPLEELQRIQGQQNIQDPESTQEDMIENSPPDAADPETLVDELVIVPRVGDLDKQ